jgi:thiamine-monophosphate kinase
VLSRPGDPRGEPDPLEWVLSVGEDHALLACFRPETALPPSFRRIGSVISRTTTTDTADTATEAAAAVLLAGARIKGPGGWRHFA